jgi:hypothetical protein
LTPVLLLSLWCCSSDGDPRSRERELLRHIEDLLGATEVVQFIVEGGISSAAHVSVSALAAAIDASAVSALRPYFRRRVERQPSDLLMFSVDPGTHYRKS